MKTIDDLISKVESRKGKNPSLTRQIIEEFRGAAHDLAAANEKAMIAGENQVAACEKFLRLSKKWGIGENEALPCHQWAHTANFGNCEIANASPRPEDFDELMKGGA